MITENEIVSDLRKLMGKVEYMATTYKNNDIWKQIDEKLDSILVKLENDRRVYGY